MAALRYPSYAQRAPKLIAGARALDFVNTVEWRSDPAARHERLSSYAEFAIWCAHAGLIAKKGARGLIAAAGRQPRHAHRVLQQAIALREAFAGLLKAPHAPARIRALDRALADLRCRPALESNLDAVQNRWVPVGAELDRPFALIALNIIELLVSRDLTRIRTCANPRCGWMFVDTSRSHTRRWCEMSTCGNRAKARAHYARHG